VVGTTNEGDVVGIDADSQKDLALNEEDAENVMGGTKKKKATTQHKSGAAAGPKMINVQYTPTSVSDAPPPDDCDPDDPSAQV
jgi:hypothetical protein